MMPAQRKSDKGKGRNLKASKAYKSLADPSSIPIAPTREGLRRLSRGNGDGHVESDGKGEKGRRCTLARGVKQLPALALALKKMVITKGEEI
jgi:hypothetical protein